MAQKEREGKVVVMETAHFFTTDRHGAKTYAARVRPLGVTAYGASREEAFGKVKRMVGAMVEAHREQGDLANWLNATRAAWSWAAD